MAKKPTNGKPNEIEQLFEAVKRGDTKPVEELLTQGVPVDCRDKEERTPLMEAADRGHVEIVKLLLDRGANANAVDVDGETATIAATYADQLEVVQILRSHGADLKIPNNQGRTALDIAKDGGADALASYLAAQPSGAQDGMKHEASTDPNEEALNPDDPAGASAAGAMLEEPESHFTEEDHPGSTAASAGAAQAPSFRATIPELDHAIADKIAAGLAPQGNVLAANEERIVFDALDNKQVRNINEKIKKVLDKASFEVGDYGIDTVFKGSYMAVLKPRSQENKRWRKLKKHPDWIYDPRRLTELIGGCAVRRLCLAEGKDVSHFTISHFIELYYAKDVKLILALAEEASTNKYTVRQLKKAVDDLREHKDDHDPGKEIIRTLDQPVPLLEDPNLTALCTDKDRVLEELSKAERKKIRALIKARKPGLDEWKGLMDTLEGILSELEDE